MIQLQKLGGHNQYDRSPETALRHAKQSQNITAIGESTSKSITQYEAQQTISILFSSFPGRDEIRQRNTAHAKTNGPDSLFSKTSKVDTIASISSTSDKEKVT